jgi:glucan-binding YG repeat protein
MEDFAVRNVKRFTLKDVLVYFPLILILALTCSSLYILRTRKQHLDTTEVENHRKISKKELKRIEKKEKAKLREEARHEMFIEKLMNDDDHYNESSGYTPEQKLEIQLRKEKENNERKLKLQSLEIKQQEKRLIETNLLSYINQNRITLLDQSEPSISIIQNLINNEMVSGIVQDDTMFIRLSISEIDRISQFVSTKGKVSNEELMGFVQIMFEEND